METECTLIVASTTSGEKKKISLESEKKRRGIHRFGNQLTDTGGSGCGSGEETKRDGNQDLKLFMMERDELSETFYMKGETWR